MWWWWWWVWGVVFLADATQASPAQRLLAEELLESPAFFTFLPNKRAKQLQKSGCQKIAKKKKAHNSLEKRNFAFTHAQIFPQPSAPLHA